MRASLTMKLTVLLLAVPAALGLIHCGGDVVTSGTSGAGGAGGASGSTSSTGSGAPTFECRAGTDKMLSCKIGVEYCRVQDSAVSSVPYCDPIPASCASQDLCKCPDFAPSCDLGSSPGSYSCDKDKDGNYEVGCFG